MITNFNIWWSKSSLGLGSLNEIGSVNEKICEVNYFATSDLPLSLKTRFCFHEIVVDKYDNKSETSSDYETFR